MQVRKLGVTIFAGLLLTAALTFLVPSALAQNQATQSSTQVALTPIAEPIRPLSGIGIIQGQVTYQAPANYQANFIGVTIKLKATEFPPWAVVTVSPSTIVMPLGGANAQQAITENAPFKVIIGTTADAPAFTPANIKITATAEQAGSIMGSSGDDSTPIQADFFSIIDARTDTPIQTGRPQAQIAYPITIQNFGNANTKVQLEITGGNVCGPESDSKDCLTVIPPSDLTLESKQTGGKLTAQTVNVQVQAPYHNGYLNKVGSVTIKVSTYYALDSKQTGDQSQITILTTTRGFYVPGFEIVALLGAVGVLALVTRSRLH